MKSVLLPLILAALGIAGGVGAGLALRPAPETAQANAGDDTGHAAPAGPEESEPGRREENDATPDYVKLNNQFVVPVVKGDRVGSLVVMSLGLEIDQGERETVYDLEPKLRDALLQAMFDHASIGGFAGSFTNGENLDILRAALTETARGVLGPAVRGVLIVNIARQDI